MRPLRLIGAFVLGAIGVWLMLWNLIDFLTQGLNFGIWDYTILQTCFPSLFVGFICVLIAAWLGVSVLKG